MRTNRKIRFACLAIFKCFLSPTVNTPRPYLRFQPYFEAIFYKLVGKLNLSKYYSGSGTYTQNKDMFVLGSLNVDVFDQ